MVGVSCMQDVMDHMEKRVKSRFSHRRILLKPPTEFEPRKVWIVALAKSGEEDIFMSIRLE